MIPIDRNIRQSLTYLIRNKSPFRWGDVLGFSKEEFFEHIKKEFSEGMSFDNYGEWVVSFHIPRRCYTFNSIRDIDFKNFWSLKNITPKWKDEAQHQKKEIDIDEVNKYGLWDILPIGNISQYLVRTKKSI
jgi:hypothetical protein